MKKRLYLHLALHFIQKNYRLSVPFAGGGILMGAMVYSVLSMIENPMFSASPIYGISWYREMLLLELPLLIFFTLILFFYLNSAWISANQKQNGLMMVLGMEKRHLYRILFYQLGLFALVTVPASLLVGVSFDQILYLFICRMIEVLPLTSLHISPLGLLGLCCWTAFCYGALFLWSFLQLWSSDPLASMQASHVSQSGRRTHWIAALAGLACLGSGYLIALLTESPSAAVFLFFAAVFLVIIGTWLTFLYGAQAFLSLLQKWKRFYYTPDHFVSLSIQKFRLRKNAWALANIAILSTMLIVTMSSTLSLVTGMEMNVQAVMPAPVEVDIDLLSEEPLAFDSTQLEQDSKDILQDLSIDASSVHVLHTAWMLCADVSDQYVAILDLDDLNRMNGTHLSLKDGQLLALTETAVQPDPLKLYIPLSSAATEASGSDSMAATYEIVEDDSLIETLEGTIPAYLMSRYLYAGHIPETMYSQNQRWQVLIDFPGADDPVLQQHLEEEFAKRLDPAVYSDAFRVNCQFRTSYRSDVMELFNALFLLGIYMCAFFMLAVILIMYYKQLSEGSEDRRRFTILQNLGFERKELRRLITRQTRILFFLPLNVALIHTLFALPILRLILTGMTRIPDRLFYTISILCFTVFSLVYYLIYKLTARTYYKLTVQTSAQEPY